MMEDPLSLELNIRHYQELLKLDRHTAETRQRLIELLATPLCRRGNTEAESLVDVRCRQGRRFRWQVTADKRQEEPFHMRS